MVEHVLDCMAQSAVGWLMAHNDAVGQFLSSTRSMLKKEKGRIEECIRKKTGIRCFPSVTSFILMRLPAGLKAAMTWSQMADNRILIRDCTNFTGLSDAFIRISLKTEAENRRAMDLLVQWCRAHASQVSRHVP